MRLLTGPEIWSVYSMRQALEDVAKAFVATSRGEADLPLRTRINVDERRTFLVMPAYSASVNAGAVKTIGLYPDNAKRGLPTAPATTVVVDGDTGAVTAVLDGDTVTKIRTGASSGVAFKYLATPDARVGVLVGTGGQAFTQVLAMVTALPDLQQVRVVNPDAKLAEDFVNRLQSWEPFTASGFTGEVVTMTDADEAAEGADAIILVTSSHEPVLSARNIKPGCVISCVGSYQPHMQECGADIVKLADRIVCDQVEACVEESGDLIIPLNDGLIRRDQLDTEIGQVISGEKPGRTDEGDVIVYETVGVGTQDLWTGLAIVEAAQAADVGTVWQSQ
ncbi:MAG: hypothetical protein Q4P06_05055 [Actinomycetaceae bacterium]|nr:hypothetical protein [Actinomycetaceae bacterium]